MALATRIMRIAIGAISVEIPKRNPSKSMPTRASGSKIETIRKKKTNHGQHSEDIIMNIREAIHENFAGFKEHKENKKSKIN